MQLSVREVAELVGVTERQVMKWIRRRALPALRINGEYRVERPALQDWAAVHGHGLPADFFDVGSDGASGGKLGLAGALERGGVHSGVSGATPHEVLRSVSLLRTIPEHVDRELLHRALVERESLCSTGVGNGFAIPHPRDPLVGLHAPYVLLCFLESAVDFGAVDGQTVSVVFVTLSPSLRQHLQLLARIAAALRDVALRHLLRVQAPGSAIVSLLRPLETTR